jgi:predicted enzyme related to lactoylglutathione lyase
MANTPRGRFVWYELLTTDPAAARDFYTKLVGWSTEAWQGSDYTMWTNKGQGLGGLLALPETARQAGVPPHWLASVTTPDLDATVAQAQKLGGQVRVPVTSMPEVGRWAVLADPQGATFTAFTPAGQPPAREGRPRVGEFSWHELMTSVEPDEALRFYQALFGWEKLEEHDMGAPVGKYLIYGLGDVPFGGMFKMVGGPPPMFWLYVRVEDVARGAATTKELGGQVLNGPMEVPGGDQIVQIQDPQGVVFALHQAAKD